MKVADEMRSRAIELVVGWLLLHSLRTLELFLPGRCLRFLFWLAAALVAGWELAAMKRVSRAFDWLPVSLRPALTRPAWRWRLWRRRTQLQLTKSLALWPDRLQTARWQSPCQYTGIEQLERACARGRPVILAVLHFGPLRVLHYCLRARGLPVAAVVADRLDHRSGFRAYLNSLSDHASGLAGVPHSLDYSEISRVWAFLRPQRLLLIAVDSDRGRQVRVQGEDFSFRMATGAIRLAARAKAIVVPCLIRATRPLGVQIHFGNPVPDAWVADKCRHASACSHLLHEFLPVLHAEPEQCSPELLYCFSSRTLNPNRAVAESVGTSL